MATFCHRAGHIQDRAHQAKGMFAEKFEEIQSKINKYEEAMAENDKIVAELREVRE